MVNRWLKTQGRNRRRDFIKAKDYMGFCFDLHPIPPDIENRLLQIILINYKKTGLNPLCSMIEHCLKKIYKVTLMMFLKGEGQHSGKLRELYET